MVGQVVEWQIGMAIARIQNGETELGDLHTPAIRAFDRMLENSIKGCEAIRRGRDLRDRAQPLASDYYQTPVPDGTGERCRQKVTDCIAAIEALAAPDGLHRMRKWTWRKVSEEGEGQREAWDLDGVPITSAIDHWMEKPGRGVIVIDWKSGQRSDEDAFQLATYGLWGQRARGHPRSRVLVQAIYLQEPAEWEPRPVSELECESAAATIREGYQAGLICSWQSRRRMERCGCMHGARPSLLSHKGNAVPLASFGRSARTAHRHCLRLTFLSEWEDRRSSA